MRKKSIICIVTLLLVFAFAVSSFATSQGIDHAKKVIKIGWFGPLTGLFQRIGEGMVDGLKAHLDQQNARGGLAGYKVNLVYYDNNMDPVLTKQVYKKLIQEDRVFALVGALGSIGINAVISDMASDGIPVVYLGGGETHWAVPPKRNIFPVQPDYITEGRLMTQFAIQNLNARRLAFIYRADDNTGRTALEGVRRAMADYGRKVGASLVLEMRRLAVNVVVARIKETNPDAVMVFDFFAGCTGIVSGAKRAGINTKWITTYVNSDAVLYQMTGAPWLGVFIGGWAKAAEPNVAAYIKYYMTTPYHAKAVSRRWDSPSGYNTAGWIASEIFFGGMKIFLRQNANDMKKLSWDTFIRAMENMRNFNDTLAKDITYLPMAQAQRGTAGYYLARSGQRTMYFMEATLTDKKQFFLKPVTQWMK